MCVKPKKESTERPVNPAEFTVGEKRAAGIAILVGIIFVSVLTYLAYYGNLEVLRPKQKIYLSTFSAKLEFTARYWPLGLLWLILNIHLIILRRVTTKAGNPMAGHENIVEQPVRIFTNSMEQFVMNAFAQVSLLPFLDVDQVVRVIPLMNALFFIGRLLFWIGYPKLRSTGFICGLLPVTMVTYFALKDLFVNFLDSEFCVFKGF
jgi:hypothetical protein